MEPLQILSRKKNNLFQSEAWADLQALYEKKTWVVKSDNIQALVIKSPLVRNKFYFYSPRGPLVSSKIKKQDIRIFFRKIESLAWEEGVIFYRIEPYSLGQSDLYDFGFRKTTNFSPLSRQHSPENTLILDITKSKNELLALMKPKWRYNINLAMRKGVSIREGKTKDDIEIFYELTKEVESRGDYRGFDKEYYLNMFRVLGRKNDLALYIAEIDGEALGAVIISFFGTVATYIHGATSSNKRELMPMYLLQWAAIREAKTRGCFLYDFWGIAPNDSKFHPWAGITRFKKGFGGIPLNLSGTFDLPFDKGYYRTLTVLNRLKKVIKK